MKLYGLTGGIASGKSTVGRYLRALGATVVDADALAREVVEPGEAAWDDIRARWPEVVRTDGTIDRKALGAVVFADPEARRELEQMTHPRIQERSARLIGEALERDEPVVFYEAALIVENDLDQAMDGLVVVSVPDELQVERLKNRDGLDETEARARLRAQYPLAKKIERATDIIDNTGTEAETQAQVEALWIRLSSLWEGK